MERETPPFMENSIKNFHFVFRNPSLRAASKKKGLKKVVAKVIAVRSKEGK